MSKIRVNQIETLDGLNTKDVATLIDDINNAAVTTSTGEQTLAAALDNRVIYVNTVNDLQALPVGDLEDGRQVNIREYHSGNNGYGGGVFVFDATANKSGHDGATVISPTVPAISEQSGATLPERRDAFLRGDGETDGAGSGCWIRHKETSYTNVMWFGIIYTEANDTDNDLPIRNAVAHSGKGRTHFPRGTYTLKAPLVLDQEACMLTGEGSIFTSLTTTETDGDTIIVDARLVSISDLRVNSVPTGRCIYLRAAQLFRSNNVTTKVGEIGLFHENGNSATISGFFAESCTYGYVMEPLGNGDVNGCTVQGRSFNCEVGIDIRPNSAPSGASNDPLHNIINYSCEGNVVGFRATADGRYNYLNIYSESNNKSSSIGLSNANFETGRDFKRGNIFEIRDPDNSEDIFISDGDERVGIGIRTQGAEVQFYTGYNPSNVATIEFTGSRSVSQINTRMYRFINTSGGTVNATMNVAIGMPVGSSIEIFKLDNTEGVNLLSPSGITFVGQTGTFGGFVSSGNAKYAKLTKLTTATVVIEQSDLS